MKLRDLEPQFLTTSDGLRLGKVDDFKSAQGIRFLCPYHFVKNQGKIGTHQILIWFVGRGVPTPAKPQNHWQAHGTGYDDLTLIPSIDLGAADWHGHVTRGEVSIIGS